MSLEDDQRAKQLEEARKRVEELRNKKKKKGKKKKTQAEDDESATKEKDEDTVKDAVVEVKDQDKEVTPQNVENAGVEDAREDEEKQDVAELAEEEVEEAGEEAGEEAREEAGEEAGEGDADAAIPDSENGKTEISKENPLDGKPVGHQANVEDLFSTSDAQEPDFLTKLAEEKEIDAKKALQEQVENLTQQLKKQKFTNMDHETTIEELEEKVQDLQSALESCKQELEATKRELEAEKRKPAMLLVENSSGNESSLNSPPLFTKFTSHASGEHAWPTMTPVATHVDRALIDKWKNWNVDMTSWRSIGSGPIVDL
ncbi:LAMI_0E02212g1_1 [Lachancea mirantina]|uniref:LAMI_0E02212g1_1 n=1 Tax=Lachancea mirantina TaxID=1230905 RepID=A0A1G4JJ53_9SACH|nr:LAMI_0E02212g1_1 [Lachancea mirantina]